MQSSTPLDLSTPDIIANPYPVYRELRECSPLPYIRLRAGSVPGTDQPMMSWALLRHADVIAAVKDPDTFSSQVASLFTVMPHIPLLQDDPPRHTRMRRLVAKAFTPKRVIELEPWVAELTRSLLDSMGSGSAEVMSGLCIPLPVIVIATMLGVPKELHGRFRTWSNAFIGYSSDIPPEERAAGRRELSACLTQLIAERRRERGRDDLISALVDVEVDGETLNDAEIELLITLLIIAGNDTTTGLLGNMLNVLAHRPELWQHAREDRSLVDPIIEETLRYESPIQRMIRRTTRDTELSGALIPAGQLVDVFFGAANRDPASFEAPDEFRLGRPAREHVAFGQGIHYCIGASLGRLEARTALNQLLDRFETLSPATELPERQRVAVAMFAYQRLPLLLGAA